jgi:hypothetical protein
MHTYILQCSSSPYLDGESNELFQSVIYTHTHTCLIVCFFSPAYVQFIMTITQFSISLCISICDVYRKSRRRQVSHAVYLLEGITSAYLEKHIYTHAPGYDGILILTITSFTCVILFPLSLSLIYRR